MIRSVLLVAFCFASPVSAAVVSRDLFEPGDGLLTCDDVNQREWLDFSVTKGMSIGDLSEAISAGGPLLGFEGANREQILELAASHNPSGLVGVEDTDLVALLGSDVFGQHGLLSGQRFTGGRVLLVGNASDAANFSEWTVLVQTTSSVERTSGNQSYVSPYIGGVTQPPLLFDQYWLYRNTARVPEPANLVLAGMALLPRFRPRVRPLTQD